VPEGKQLVAESSRILVAGRQPPVAEGRRILVVAKHLVEERRQPIAEDKRILVAARHLVEERR
jgi:hypothetical protein